MNLRSKLLVIVGAAALGLLLVMALTALIGVRETNELKAIEGRLLPRLALGPRLESDFERIGRTLQDAVAARDRQTVDHIHEIRDRMVQRMAAAPGAVRPDQAAAIERKLDDYLEKARDVTLRLIHEETGEATLAAMAAMQTRRAAALEALTQATRLDERQLASHFDAIHTARATAAQLRLVVSAACLAIVLLLSIKLSRSVLAVVRDLSAGFRRFGRGDLAHPIPVTTDDEIGHLSIEANQMAARLRATLERLAGTSAELAHANEELQAFSYSVAHDLRAPLRALNGYAHLLLEEYGDKMDGEGRNWLFTIERNAIKMAELIEGLLSLARLTRGDLRLARVDISALARATGAQLASAGPERSVDLVVEEGLEANADPRLVRALIENLVGNAWKFTSKVASPRIEVGATEVEGSRAFFVRDNGAGFDETYAGKLFTPFQRLHDHSEFPGTGIGLATVQRIVKRHGGRVWAEGKVGEGATFYFTLPEPSMAAQPASGASDKVV